LILVGGVSQLYQGDLNLGRHAVRRLAAALTQPDVVVEDLYYGAVAVAQRLQDLRPDALVLIGSAARGRIPGTVKVRRIELAPLPADQLQGAVADAVTGYVSIDLILDLAGGLGALPATTIVIEVEPAGQRPGVPLSAEAQRGLELAVGAALVHVDSLTGGGTIGSAS